MQPSSAFRVVRCGHGGDIGGEAGRHSRIGVPDGDTQPTPATFAAFLAALKKEPLRATPIEVTFDGQDTVRLRTAGTVITTDRGKWNAFLLGVHAGEFDRFVESTLVHQAALTRP